MIEVIIRIAELKGIKQPDFEEMRSTKAEKRGGFKDNLFLVKTLEK